MVVVLYHNIQSSNGSKHYCVVIGLLMPVLQQLVLLAFLTTHIEVRSTQWLFHFSLLHAMTCKFYGLEDCKSAPKCEIDSDYNFISFFPVNAGFETVTYMLEVGLS